MNMDTKIEYLVKRVTSSVQNLRFCIKRVHYECVGSKANLSILLCMALSHLCLSCKGIDKKYIRKFNIFTFNNSSTAKINIILYE